MKKIFILLLLTVSITAFGQDYKELKKELKNKKKTQQYIDKAYKDKINELKKQGFKIHGSTKTLGEAMYKHDEKIKSGNYEKVIFITVQNCPNVNLCSRKALADAATEYAQRTNSFVLGKVTSEARLNANPGGKKPSKDAIDKFGQAFTQEVSAQVSNVLEESYTIITERKSNSYELQVYYLVEKEIAKKARQAAYERTLEFRQSQAATDANLEWMNSVSDFLSEEPSENPDN